MPLPSFLSPHSKRRLSGSLVEQLIPQAALSSQTREWLTHLINLVLCSRPTNSSLIRRGQIFSGIIADGELAGSDRGPHSIRLECLRPCTPCTETETDPSWFTPVSVSDVRSTECAAASYEILRPVLCCLFSCPGSFCPISQRLKGASSLKLQSVSLFPVFTVWMFICCPFSLSRV